MDQLPISIVSNDLKYAMTSLKIKTLQKAREYYHNQHEIFDNQRENSQILQTGGIGDKLQKIKKYLIKYDTVKEEVWKKINMIDLATEDETQIPSTLINSNHNSNQPIQYDRTQTQQIPKFTKSMKQTIQQLFQDQQSTEKKQKIQRKQFEFSSSRESYDNITFDRVEQDKNGKIQKLQWNQNSNQSLTQSLNKDNNNNKKQQRYISNLRKPSNLFQKSIEDNSIVQICGAKGVGKTALLLYFCQKYSEISNKKIYFINCAAGITHKRFERLSNKCPNLQYRDSYILQHVLAVCRSAARDPETGCIAVDSLTNLLMEEQKTLIFLIKIFKIFSSLLPKGCKIVISNYIQQWFQHKEDDFLTNHYSYYSSVTSEFIKYKYFLKKWPKTDKVLIKMIRGGFIQGEYTIKNDGLDKILIKDEQK